MDAWAICLWFNLVFCPRRCPRPHKNMPKFHDENMTQCVIAQDSQQSYPTNLDWYHPGVPVVPAQVNSRLSKFLGWFVRFREEKGHSFHGHHVLNSCDRSIQLGFFEDSYAAAHAEKEHAEEEVSKKKLQEEHGSLLTSNFYHRKLSVCLYVCMYVRMYVRMNVCMHVCMHACMHVCMHLYIIQRLAVCMCFFHKDSISDVKTNLLGAWNWSARHPPWALECRSLGVFGQRVASCWGIEWSHHLQ